MQQRSSYDHITYRHELLRKGIHLSSLSIPIIYAFIARELALWILACIFTPVFIVDVARRWVPPLERLVRKLFGSMMRPHELDKQRLLLNGATYVLMSAIMCIMLFPKIIAITAFAVLIVSDIASALIGRKFGKTQFFDKSLEGTSAFWISSWLVVIVVWLLTQAPWQYAVLAACATFIGGIVEAASIRLRMDDNFSIPLSIGCVLWMLIALLDRTIQAQIMSLLV
ncbi:MAG: SEC59/DGK1/VTE5 family protein [Bacteroidota bacterium]|nr:SEC59/DGK1/VTE5 family protein [Candidatus Kapabacteria bacterium]MDW8221160.1 SEC59/DGK1/VTE5 family protein [Bacteroidota bacterium]